MGTKVRGQRFTRRSHQEEVARRESPGDGGWSRRSQSKTKMASNATGLGRGEEEGQASRLESE